MTLFSSFGKSSVPWKKWLNLSIQQQKFIRVNAQSFEKSSFSKLEPYYSTTKIATIFIIINYLSCLFMAIFLFRSKGKEHGKARRVKSKQL